MSTNFSKETNLDGDEPRPSKGQTSRAAILHTAAKLATTKGLIGLSIGDLAAEVGMSKSILDAQALGEIDPRAEVDQVVFEIQAMLLAANFLFVMSNDPMRLTQSRRGVENVLARWGIRAESKKKRSARGTP